MDKKVKIAFSAMVRKKDKRKNLEIKIGVFIFLFLNSVTHKVTLYLNSPMVLYHVRKKIMLSKVSLTGKLRHTIVN